MNRNKKTKNKNPNEAIDYITSVTGFNDFNSTEHRENVNTNKKHKITDFAE